MRISFLKNRIFLLSMIVLFAFISGCAMTAPLKPEEIIPPKPRLDNKGAYLCPYTQDGVMAEWVDKAINAKIGATVGKHTGAYAGQQLLENVPFIGGLVGQHAGEAIGRKIAIECSGGWEYIQETSDVSFDTLEDLSIYLYAVYSSNEHFKDALEATMEIYPEMKTKYYPAITHAPKKEAPEKDGQ